MAPGEDRESGSEAARSGARGRGLRGVLVDTTPLKHSPEFARLWFGTSVSQIGAQMTIVAVGLHIYELTHSTLAVSLVALWALGPMILAGFVGGALADRFDRRTVALATAVVAWLSIGTLTTIAFLGVSATWPYYALAAVNAASATIMGATRGAIQPMLLPTQLLLAAIALAGCGAADNVSSVFRTTILQAAAPDDVRGRMQGLFYVVVAGGPRIGDLLAGTIATAIALWAPALLGGLIIIALMLVLRRVYGGFQRYDAVHPTP